MKKEEKKSEIRDEIEAFLEDEKNGLEEEKAVSKDEEKKIEHVKEELEEEERKVGEAEGEEILIKKKIDDEPEEDIDEALINNPTPKKRKKEAEDENETPAEAAGKAADSAKPPEMKTLIYALRTTANREDQVMSFITSNVVRKKIQVYSVIRPHGMRGYIFIEAEAITDAEQGAFGVPYARGVLSKDIQYKEIEHMLERVKKEVNILKNDIVEIISGPFKREKAKITRVDKTKEEVVVELLEAAVPIPVTVKMDAVKVIRRDSDDSKD